MDGPSLLGKSTGTAESVAWRLRESLPVSLPLGLAGYFSCRLGTSGGWMSRTHGGILLHAARLLGPNGLSYNHPALPLTETVYSCLAISCFRCQSSLLQGCCEIHVILWCPARVQFKLFYKQRLLPGQPGDHPCQNTHSLPAFMFPDVVTPWGTLGAPLSFNFCCPQLKEEVAVSGVERKHD